MGSSPGFRTGARGRGCWWEGASPPGATPGLAALRGPAGFSPEVQPQPSRPTVARDRTSSGPQPPHSLDPRSCGLDRGSAFAGLLGNGGAGVGCPRSPGPEPCVQPLAQEGQATSTASPLHPLPQPIPLPGDPPPQSPAPCTLAAPSAPSPCGVPCPGPPLSSCGETFLSYLLPGPQPAIPTQLLPSQPHTSTAHQAPASPTVVSAQQLRNPVVTPTSPVFMTDPA